MEPYCPTPVEHRPSAKSVAGLPHNWDRTSRAQRHGIRQLMQAELRAALDDMLVQAELDEEEWRFWNERYLGGEE